MMEFEIGKTYSGFRVSNLEYTIQAKCIGFTEGWKNQRVPIFQIRNHQPCNPIQVNSFEDQYEICTISYGRKGILAIISAEEVM